VDNPFVVGEAIGAGFALALVVFVVARRLCGPAGARHLARLNRIAGEDVQDSGFSLYVRDWLPYVAALLAAVVGVLFSVVQAGVLFRRAFSAGDLPKLVAGFQSGCHKSCLPARDAAFCDGFCDCTLATLRTNHAGDAAFAKWMQSGAQDVEAVRAEVLQAQNQCLGALASSGATTSVQQPASVSPLRPHLDAEAPPATLKLDVPAYEPAVLRRIQEDLAPFLSWAAVAKVSHEELAGSEICATGNEPSAGICTKSVAAPGLGDQVFSVSYKPGVVGAVRMTASLPLLVGCNVVVPSSTLAQWRDGETERQLCEITSGALRGLRLLAVRGRLGTSLFVFTPSYPAYDAGFRAGPSPTP
jgi:hypothetical protein